MPGQGLYDLVFRPGTTSELGVMIERAVSRDAEGRVRTAPAIFKGGYAAAEADDVDSSRSIPQVQADFSGGALYSKVTLPNGYAFGAPAYCRSPRGATPPGASTPMSMPGGVTLGAITDAFELGGSLYFLAGRYALKLASGTGSPTVTQDLGVGFVADGAAVFNGAAYVGGSGGNIWKMTSAGAWSQSADVSHRKAGVVTWLVPSEGAMVARLVMATLGLTAIRYTGGDPMSIVNWTPNPTSIPVGDSSYPITSIAASPNHVYICKQDGLYDLNSRGETPNLTPEWLRQPITSDNGAASIYRDGFLFLGHATGADRYNARSQQRANLSTWVFPSGGVPNETPAIGPITAWALDQGWLLAAVYNATTNTSYLMAGRNRGEPGVPDGPGAMLWHGAEAVVPGRVTLLRSTTVSGVPRLWIAARNGAATTLSWQYLPNAVNPLAELGSGSAFRFGSTFTLYTSAYDWQDADALKVLRVLGIRADGLGSGVGIDVYTNAEGGAWTFQDTADASPRSRITPRAPLTSGHEIGVKLVGSGTATMPPVLRAVKLDGELLNEQFDRRVYPVRCGKRQALRGGGSDPRDAVVVWEGIASLHTVEGGIVQMRDQDGTTLNVRVHPIAGYTATEDEAYSGTYTRSGVLPFTVLEIISTAASGLLSLVYDDGTRYDDATKAYA